MYVSPNEGIVMEEEWWGSTSYLPLSSIHSSIHYVLGTLSKTEESLNASTITMKKATALELLSNLSCGMLLVEAFSGATLSPGAPVLVDSVLHVTLLVLPVFPGAPRITMYTLFANAPALFIKYCV